MKLALLLVASTAVAEPSQAPVTQLAVGATHTCALHGDGSVSCWGDNSHHALGLAAAEDQSRPVRVPGIDDATAIGADAASTCVRRKDGSVACWGQLAPTVDVATPTPIEMTDTVQLAGRCARTATQVECLSKRSQVVTITGAGDAIDVAAFANDGCVVHKRGTVGCWHSPTELTAIAVRDAVQVAIADRFACARLRDGNVSCWDWRMPEPIITMRATPQGQQPRTRSFPATPRHVLAGATAIAGGGNQICAVDRRGVACWGEDRVVARIAGLTKVTALAVGPHSCVVRGDRDVACWGAGTHGELGNGWSEAQPTPVVVPGIDDVVEIAASVSPGTGDSQYAAARRRDGKVFAWGMLHPSNSPDGTAVPTVTALHGGKKLVAGIVLMSIDDKGHLWNGADKTPHLLVSQPVLDATTECAIDASHHVACWGSERWTNDVVKGTAGDDFWSIVPGLDDAVALAGSCALTADGHVTCFRARKLERAKAIDHGVAIGAGSFATCALREDHSVACWGQAGSWLLDGSPLTAPRSDVVRAIPVANIAALSVGSDHACALLADATVACWGDNRDGQLGDGTRNSRTAPQPVRNLTDVIQVAAGTDFTCALVRDGHVKCWGAAMSGQVGSYMMRDVRQPTAVAW